MSRKYRWPSIVEIPGASTSPDGQGANMSRWGVTTLRMAIRLRFMSNSTPSCASVGCFRISSSSSSIRSSNVVSTGKKLSIRPSTIR